MSRVAVVTGGAGFLGSHLCDRLLADDYRVVCVDNFSTGDMTNVSHLQKEERFVLAQQDVRRPLEIDELPDVVLHLASRASPPAYLADPIGTLQTGSVGTSNALELATKSSAIFLLASTSEVYGDPEVRPQSEEYRGNVSTTGPRSVYDEAKRFGEALTMAYQRERGIDTRIARIFNTYGPRLQPGDGRAVSNFIRQALAEEPVTVNGDGSQTRSFCYVDDLIDGLMALVQSSFHEPVNLGNPDERSILELAEYVIEKTGSKSEIMFQDLPQDDPLTRCPDIARARHELGWEPEVSLSDGLDRTIAWFRSLSGALVPS